MTPPPPPPPCYVDRNYFLGASFSPSLVAYSNNYPAPRMRSEGSSDCSWTDFIVLNQQYMQYLLPGPNYFWETCTQNLGDRSGTGTCLNIVNGDCCCLLLLFCVFFVWGGGGGGGGLKGHVFTLIGYALTNKVH